VSPDDEVDAEDECDDAEYKAPLEIVLEGMHVHNAAVLFKHVGP